MLPEKIKNTLALHKARESILDFLKSFDTGLLDQEHIKYFEDQYSFSAKEYREFCEYISKQFDINKIKIPNVGHVFSEYLYCFIYDKHKYIFRLLFGQGSAYDLIDAENKSIMTALKLKFTKKNSLKLQSLAAPFKL